MRYAFVTLLLYATCSGGPEQDQCGPTHALVARVIDGDTIELANGEKVRYLLVDAPELSEQACYAQEARSFNASMVSGREVELEYSNHSCRDRYGRLLAYVRVGGQDVNKTLVSEGYACAYIFEPGTEPREEEFEALEAQAIALRKGLWGVCQEVPCGR